MYFATYNIWTPDKQLEKLEEEQKHIELEVLGLSEKGFKGEMTTLCKSEHIQKKVK